MVKKAFHSLVIASLTFTSSFAQDSEPAPTEIPAEALPPSKYQWETSGKGKLGNQATIEIPEGMKFLNGRETDLFMQENGNLPDTYLGMISTDDEYWFVIFEYDPSGYVKDDEKDDLDADEFMKSFKESDEYGNEERLKAGLDTLYTIGWAMEPTYNAQTNNLEYGIILESGRGSRTVNYFTFLLGREGTMKCTLLCNPEDLQTIQPDYQSTLTGFQFNAGKTYAEFQEGDKVAEYGLKALVAGGAVFAAAKLGIFAKLLLFFKKGLKLIVVGVLAVGVWLKRLITGKRADA